MNAQELQYMMETNEFSLAETLIIAELRRRDEVENALRSEINRLKSELEKPSPAESVSEALRDTMSKAKRKPYCKPDVWKTGEGQCATTLPVIMSPDERIEKLESQIRDRDTTIHELNSELTELKSKNSTLRKRFAARG